MIFTSPERPVGPVEAGLLADLAPVFSVRVVPAGGTTFRVLEGGGGPPLVLLHGRGNAATVWAPWLLPLARTHRVIAPDFPGFGATPAGQLRPGGAEDGLDYFTAPIAELLSVMRIDAAALVGHSLGGLVAIELALRRSITARALVLIGSMGVGPTMTLASRAYFLAGPERLARALGKDLFSKLSPLPDHEWGRKITDLGYELASVPGGRPVPSAAFNRLIGFGGAFHRLERLREITAPVLLVWGDHDAAFPAPAALVAAAAFPKGRAALFPLGHSPQVEDPERVLTEVTSFLQTA